MEHNDLDKARRNADKTNIEEQLRSGNELRWYFTTIVFGIIAVTAILVCIFTYALDTFGLLHMMRLNLLSILLSVFLFSMFVGTCITVILASNVLKPINNLCAAMSRVASGDFTVKLNEESRFAFVRKLNKDFNDMVYKLGTVETLRNDFVSNVSHEFKTPLGSIEGYAMLLQDNNVSKAEQAEYVDRILFNSKRLSTLVGNILMLSKIETQSIPIQRSRYRIDEQIRQCILTLEPKWSLKCIEFEMNMETVEFAAIEPLMNHVFLNLADNAVKFSPENGIIYIDLSEHATELRFRIANIGPAISGEAMKHIFEKFYQGDTSHRSEGNGLGLALVAKIITLHGGSITAHNTPDGLVEFVFSLPKQH